MTTILRRHAFSLILFAATAWRLAYLLAYVELPLIDGPMFDSEVYLHQAAAIDFGYHGDSSLLAMSPLYGYFLYALGAPSELYVPIAVQILMGIATMALIGAYCARIFGRTAGLFCTIFAAFYAVFPFYETKHMGEALGLFLLVLALWISGWCGFGAPSTLPSHRRFALSVLAGATLAMAVLARASFLFICPFWIAASVFPSYAEEQWAAFRPRINRTMGFVIGLSIVFVGHGLWNLKHSGLFVPVILQSNTVSKATAPDFGGSFFDLSQSTLRPPSPWDVVREARVRIEDHRKGWHAPPGQNQVNWSGYIRNLPRKFWATFEDNEQTGFDYAYYGERSELATLRAFPISFGCLLSLSVGGIFALWLRRRNGSLRGLVVVSPLMLGALSTTTLFHSSTRYRLPLSIAFTLLAGVALAHIVHMPRTRARIGLLALTGTLVAFFAWRNATYDLRNPNLWHLRLAEAYLRHLPEPEPAHFKNAQKQIEVALALSPQIDPPLRHRLRYLQSLAPHIRMVPAAILREPAHLTVPNQ